MQQSALKAHPLSSRRRWVHGRASSRSTGGRELVRKLLALGLRIGSEIRVEHHRGRGLVVSAGAARVALVGGIVEKLMVVPLDGGGNGTPADVSAGLHA